ncbi:hypothetical protein ABDB91_01260 [Desulfoscipio sp. XC116]|uniref:hypothetical protein n=1 Tax=Desulfoscipio sp. XC116 TaxID=3144975 RepID=UPI00325B8F59
MDISLHHLTKDELYELLDSFSESFLSQPLAKNPDHFAQATKGFRINKLPKSRLFPIYYNEISGFPGCPLELFLVPYLEKLFGDLSIPDLFTADDVDDFSLGLLIEAAIRKSKISINGSKQIPEIPAYAVLQLYKRISDETLKRHLKQISDTIESCIEQAIRTGEEKCAISIDRVRAEAAKSISEKENKIEKLINQNHVITNQLHTLQAQNLQLQEETRTSRQQLEKSVTIIKKYEIDNEKIRLMETEIERLTDEETGLSVSVKQLQEQINSITLELQSSSSQLQQQKRSLGKAMLEYKQIKEQTDVLSDQWEQREEIGRNIDDKIKRRLQHTKECISEFFIEYAIYAGTSITDTENSTGKSVEYNLGKMVDEDPYEVQSMRDLFECMSENLEVVGVASEHIPALAAYLIAAYANKVPLILAGYGAVDIADAMSVTINNRLSNKAYCYGKTDVTPLLGSASASNIIAVHDAFQSNCMNKLLQAVAISQHYYYFILSTSEELYIEPKGIFDYALPIFTEFFVDKRASRNWGGSACKIELKFDNVPKVRVDLPKHTVSKLAFTQCSELLACYSAIANENAIFYGFLLQTMPIMLALGKREKLLDIIDNAKLSDKEKEELLMLCGEGQ